MHTHNNKKNFFRKADKDWKDGPADKSTRDSSQLVPGDSVLFSGFHRYQTWKWCIDIYAGKTARHIK